MRQLFSLWCSLVMACAGSGCVSSATPATPPRAGDFHVLLPSRPASLNPVADLDESAFVVARSLFNQLLVLNEAGRLLPDLAASWTVSPDGLVYTFTLRRDVQWHDGTPFTAADVRWTLEAIRKDGFMRTALAPVASIAAPGAHTVVITLQHPWAPFAVDLGGLGMAILPRHLYEGRDWRANPANHRPIGTGPFRFSRWDGDTLVLEANDRYFRRGPFVSRVRFTAAGAEDSEWRLRRGDADYSIVRPPALVAGAAAPPVVVRMLPSSARYYLVMNLRRPPFDDVKVRRAIAQAIDRPEIVRTALGGVGAPAVGWYTPDVEWAYHAAARVPAYAPAASRRAFAARNVSARLRVSGRTTAALVVPNLPPLRDVADEIHRQLSAAGLTTDLVKVPLLEWQRRVMRARDFDLSIFGGTHGPDPDALRQRFAADTETGGYLGYVNPRFQAAVEAGARTNDIEQRAAAYHQAQEILAADVPFVPLAEGVRVVVHHERVRGLPQLEASALVGAFDFSLVTVERRQDGSR